LAIQGTTQICQLAGWKWRHPGREFKRLQKKSMYGKAIINFLDAHVDSAVL